MRRVKLISTARRRVPSRHFELLGSALVQRKRVWLRYFKRSDRSTSEREVSPQRLVNYRNTWYLDAWCHASESMRRFALEAAQWVAHEEWHAQQKAGWLDDGRYELQVPYSDPTELAMDILRHGDSVQVVGDKALMASIEARLRNALRRYASR